MANARRAPRRQLDEADLTSRRGTGIGATMFTALLQELYDSEINVAVSSFWHDGWRVGIGDDLNGFKATADFKNDGLDTAAALWLEAQAVALYPRSDFAKARVST